MDDAERKVIATVYSADMVKGWHGNGTFLNLEVVGTLEPSLTVTLLQSKITENILLSRLKAQSR